MANYKMHTTQKELFIGAMGNVAAREDFHLKTNEMVLKFLLDASTWVNTAIM